MQKLCVTQCKSYTVLSSQFTVMCYTVQMLHSAEVTKFTVQYSAECKSCVLHRSQIKSYKIHSSQCSQCKSYTVESAHSAKVIQITVQKLCYSLHSAIVIQITIHSAKVVCYTVQKLHSAECSQCKSCVTACTVQ